MTSFPERGPSSLSYNPGASESSGRKPIRVLIADDHPLVRNGLRGCLARHGRFLVVGEAADGREAVARAKELSPDLVLMDIDMPKLNGLSATEILHRDNPKMKILILSVHDPAQYVLPAIKAGARGYLSKNAPTEELLQAIEMVAAGESYFNSDASLAALNQLTDRAGAKQGQRQISPREREVLVAITDGLLNKEIASKLGVGTRTVETHRERIMRKLNLRGVADLTRFAIAHGLVSLPKAPAAPPL